MVHTQLDNSSSKQVFNILTVKVYFFSTFSIIDSTMEFSTF